MAQEEKETIEYWKEKYATTEIENLHLKETIKKLNEELSHAYIDYDDLSMSGVSD